ncbi:macro domain-containing protein [Lewinella sp. W8]|uniref:macro domain-containing protein n=1 Tax=Lewinella sp. W8 TaxID=2528208 RepID=UPI00106731E0|nr:macro domain-containing protein [Lewinella sp. W8]MTB52699.1 phosphatase [Lewinella sp. W8]
MKIIQGDLIKLALEGKFDVIVHGCNCFCTMGAGIAKGIKAVFPDAYYADLATEKGDRSKLGTFSSAQINQGDRVITVVNAYTQFHWRGQGKKVDYQALRLAFRAIKESFSGLRIGYPAIGAGLAGGDWAIIEGIIEEELLGEDHTFVEFTG